MATAKFLKEKVQEGKAVLGTERVCKQLQQGTLAEVFLARNCQERARKDIYYYARLANVPVTELDLTNEEVGILCKKNFVISVAAVTA